MKKIVIRKMTDNDAMDLWGKAYTQESPQWSHYNAPYFNEYKQYSKEEFIESELKFYVNNNGIQGIFLDSDLVGTVNAYWESKETKWLECGILIFNESLWSQGIGSRALKLWIDSLFESFPDIERVGFSTWSGNPGMMKLGEKLGMTLEGCMRKCRYYNGVYYDAIKYGVLRDEWFK